MATIMARPAIPPTTPPAIAPTLVEGAGVVAGVEVPDIDVVEVDIRVLDMGVVVEAGADVLKGVEVLESGTDSVETGAVVKLVERGIVTMVIVGCKEVPSEVVVATLAD
jgi:hypothetical protein